MEHFGFDEESSHLVFNGEKDWRNEEAWEEEYLDPEEAKRQQFFVELQLVLIF